MDFDRQVFIVDQGSLCELLHTLAALGSKSQTAAASWALRCRGLLHSVVVAELLWPGAQLCLMNYPKDQLGYFDSSSSFIGVVTEPGGLAVVTLRAAISGTWRGRAATAHPRMRQPALVTRGYFSRLLLAGGSWPGKGFAGGSVHRGMLTVLSAATAAGVTPAQPGIFIPNISTLCGIPENLHGMLSLGRGCPAGRSSPGGSCCSDSCSQGWSCSPSCQHTHTLSSGYLSIIYRKQIDPFSYCLIIYLFIFSLPVPFWIPL